MQSFNLIVKCLSEYCANSSLVEVEILECALFTWCTDFTYKHAYMSVLLCCIISLSVYVWIVLLLPSSTGMLGDFYSSLS